MADDRTPTEVFDWATLVRTLRTYALFTMTRDGIIDSWNEGVERLLGYREEEFVGQSAAMLFTPEDRAAGAPRSELEAALEQGEAQDDRWHVRRDGSSIWINGLVTPVHDGRDEHLGYLKVMRDQTEAQLAAERLARRAREQRALADIGAFTLQHTDLNEVFQYATHVVAEALQVPHVHAFDLTDPEFQGRPRAGVGPMRERRHLDDVPRPAADVLEGAGDSVPPGVFVPLDADLQRAGIRTGVRVPLRGRRGAYGYLDAFDETDDAFAPEDLRFLQSVANLLSGALDQSRLQEELAHRAEHDALTGLPHREPFEARLRGALDQGREAETRVAVLFFDLDRFKEINDELGHEVGDAVLRTVAGRVADTVRQRDTTARMGGDEFAVFLPDVHDWTEVARVCERLLRTFREPIEIGERQILVTTTIGISVFPDDAVEPRGLLQAADGAMYAGKHVGRNTYRFFGPDRNEANGARQRFQDDLRQAIERGQIELHFEPRLNLASGAFEAVEAIPYWPHPDGGDATVEALFGMANEAGAVSALVDWTLQSACAQQRAWAGMLGYAPRISVRVHAGAFLQPTFPATCEALVGGANPQPGLIELMVTETTMQEAAELTERHATALRNAGFWLGLDDVGDGPVALTRLVALPWSELRLSPRLTEHVEGQEARNELLQALASHAARVARPLAAYDVRSAAQRDALKALGVTLVQGPAIAAAGNADDALARLRRNGQAPVDAPKGA